MEKIVGEWTSSAVMTDEEAKKICRFGQGPECCAFLTVGPKGFVCERMNYAISFTIFDRLEKGTMKAKGEGGWEGCAWEDISR